MKRETYTHPKLYSLAGRLGVSRVQAIGHLCLLWDFTACHALAGDVGKWDDAAIARFCDWPGEPSRFVTSLVEAGWLDESSKYRLIVHDWYAHCERWVKLKAQKTHIEFIENIAEPSIGGSIEGSIEGRLSRDQTKPNLSGQSGTEPICRLQKKHVEAIPELASSSLVAVDPVSAKGMVHGVYAQLKDDHLDDTRTIVEWHAKQLSVHDPVLGNTEADLLFAIAAGLWASRIPEREVKKSRTAAFVNVISRLRFRVVSSMIPEAVNRLREYRERKSANGIQVKQPQPA